MCKKKQPVIYVSQLIPKFPFAFRWKLIVLSPLEQFQHLSRFEHKRDRKILRQMELTPVAFFPKPKNAPKIGGPLGAP
jgi:hypothetical protein